MSEFRIEKVQHQLKITLANGERLSGMVFLEPIARHHTGQQDPRELLNDADGFFPFAVGGHLLLIAKDQVKFATYAGNAEPPMIGPPTIGVRVSLADGTVVDGAVEIEGRSDAHRLLDYLNGFDDRFLSMTVDRTKHCLVNRRLIVGVQQR
jgi:hypothetical protein